MPKAETTASRGGARVKKPVALAAAKPIGKRSMRTVQQREADLAWIASRMVRGIPGPQIIAEFNASHEIGIVPSTFYRDQSAVIDRWRQQAKAHIDEAKGAALAKIEQLESKCWTRIDALEAGQTREVTTLTSYVPLKVGKAAPGDETPQTGTMRKTKTKGHEQNLGTWIRTLQWCIEQRCRIMGLYAPVKLQNTGTPLFGSDGGQLPAGDTFNINFTIGSERPVEELAKFEVIDIAPAAETTAGGDDDVEE